jgi:hypothetical protein
MLLRSYGLRCVRVTNRVLKQQGRHDSRQVDADVLGMELQGRECDPAFLAGVPWGLRGGIE